MKAVQYNFEIEPLLLILVQMLSEFITLPFSGLRFSPRQGQLEKYKCLGLKPGLIYCDVFELDC